MAIGTKELNRLKLAIGRRARAPMMNGSNLDLNDLNAPTASERADIEQPLSKAVGRRAAQIFLTEWASNAGGTSANTAELRRKLTTGIGHPGGVQIADETHITD